METYYDWPMDKDINDFLEVVGQLDKGGQSSTANVILYLIKRVEMAEDKEKK